MLGYGLTELVDAWVVGRDVLTGFELVITRTRPLEQVLGPLLSIFLRYLSFYLGRRASCPFQNQ